MMETCFNDFPGQSLRDLDRLDNASPFRNEPRNVGAGCDITAFVQGLDAKSNRGFVHERL